MVVAPGCPRLGWSLHSWSYPSRHGPGQPALGVPAGTGLLDRVTSAGLFPQEPCHDFDSVLISLESSLLQFCVTVASTTDAAPAVFSLEGAVGSVLAEVGFLLGSHVSRWVYMCVSFTCTGNSVW